MCSPHPYLGESGDVDRELDRCRPWPSSRRHELAVFAVVSSLDQWGYSFKKLLVDS